MQPLKLAYNTQVNRSIGVTLFSLEMSREPPGPTTTKYGSKLPLKLNGRFPEAQMKLQLLQQLQDMRTRVEKTMHEDRDWYKK